MAADKPGWTEPPSMAVTMGIVRLRGVKSIVWHQGLGGWRIAVTERALDGVDVDSGFEQVRGEGVAQRVDAPPCAISARQRAAWYMRWALFSHSGPAPLRLRT